MIDVRRVHRGRVPEAVLGLTSLVEAMHARIAGCHELATLLGYAPVFGTLGRERGVVDAVARHALRLRRDGVRATLEAME